MKSPWVALGTSLFILLALGYTCVILSEPGRSLPLISTQKSIATSEHERWIFVGDVHGMYDEFRELMAKVRADASDARVVLLGDFVSKGPQSSEMVDYIAQHQNSTHCVLGNHEVNVMFAYLNNYHIQRRPTQKHPNWTPLSFNSEQYIPPRDQVGLNHKRLARELGEDRLITIATNCSALLRVQLGAQELVAVHAGLDPDLTSSQIPRIKDITTMKYMLPKDHSKTSKEKFKHSRRWYKFWDKHAPENTTVLYGHDASSGLNLRKRTKGLDSACVGGGQLSALEFVNRDGHYEQVLHQVRCRAMI